jgi:pyridoxal phosphate enzyme (YggS family)
MIATALDEVRQRVSTAARRSGRRPEDVLLIAVSKLHPEQAIRDAYALGQRDFGENYAQELRDKARALTSLPDLRWHALGALQRNKARYVAEHATVLHATHSREVATELDRRCAAFGRTLTCLIEVALVPEAGKAGVAPPEVAAAADAIAACGHLRLGGLMCIPPPAAKPEDSRPYFAQLRSLGEALRQAHPKATDLSMGMTADFEVAIEEGATMVRVGTAIFGAR